MTNLSPVAISGLGGPAEAIAGAIRVAPEAALIMRSGAVVAGIGTIGVLADKKHRTWWGLGALTGIGGYLFGRYMIESRIAEAARGF